MPDPSTANTAQSLTGTGVLVTRPARQAEPLCKLIESVGGRALRFPVLEILDPSDTAALATLRAQLHTFDIAIFVSVNAVQKVFEQPATQYTWPDSLRIAAIGPRTAEELAAHGHPARLCPTHTFDSESLLALEELQQVAGKHIVIFRGEGGRELLGDKLRERGAQVDYAEVYRRARPQADVEPLLEQWHNGEIDVVTVASNESLHNLFDLLGKSGRRFLRATPLLVPSPRCARLAQELGFEAPVIVAENAGDAAMLAALIAWKASTSA